MVPCQTHTEIHKTGPFVAMVTAVVTASLEARRRRHSLRLASLLTQKCQAVTTRDTGGVHITHHNLNLFERDLKVPLGDESDGLILVV